MTTATNQTTSSQRRAALHALPMIAAVVVAGSTVYHAEDLPALVASHWSGSTADGWMSPAMLTLLNGGLLVVLGYGLLALGLRIPRGKLVRPVVGMAMGLVAFIATLHVVTLMASVGAVSEAAVPFPSGGLLNAIGISVLAGVLGWAIAEEGDDDATIAMEVERLTIEPGEAVVWNGMARMRTAFLALPSLIALSGVVLVAIGEALAGAVLLLSASLVMTVIRVRVTVGPKGLRVRSGPMGLIGTTVALQDITAVHAEHIEPMMYGGWGLRIVPGARAVIVRCGPGMRVERAGKPDLIVTVDDAPRGAGVLLAHMGRDGASTA